MKKKLQNFAAFFVPGTVLPDGKRRDRLLVLFPKIKKADFRLL